MDREVVVQKLESLRRCLQRIKTKCPADAGSMVVGPNARYPLIHILKRLQIASALVQAGEV
jgi:hypothetical protein